MPTIKDLPAGVGDFGQDFNYASWSANSMVELCNVPWNNDYRDIYRPATREDLDDYITSRVSSTMKITNMTRLRRGAPIHVDIPFNLVANSNYLRVTNPATPFTHRPGDVPSVYYYFILDFREVNPNNTQIVVQLDVWSTYFDRVIPLRGFVENGHAGIANSNAYDGVTNFGKEYLTVPEGFDLGSEYDILRVRTQRIASKNFFDVIVWSTVDLDADPGTLLDPNLATASGSTFHNMPNGASAYWFSNTTFNDFLLEYQNYPWVTQGIISVMAVPLLHEYIPGFVGTPGQRLTENTTPAPKDVEMAADWRNDIEWMLPARYRHLKKFFTYPYCVLELTTNNGTPLLLKPEQWDRDADITLMPYFSLPSPRMTVIPKRYNVHRSNSGASFGHDGGEFLDMATGIMNFPTFSVVNNGYMSYMASNQNNIAYQYSAADWSQTRAMQAASTGFDQSTKNMGTASAMTGIGVTQAQETANLANATQGSRSIQSGANAVVNGLGQAVSGGRAGMASGAMTAITGIGNAGADYLINTNQTTQQMAISTNAMRKSNSAQLDNMAFQRDTNLDFAQFAAKGDYANTTKAIQAKVQDAKMIQPTVSGQVGGDAFNLAMYQWSADLKIKMVNAGAMRGIGEFWLRYGYSVNAFFTPPVDFKVMSKFSYWKFQEFYLDASPMPEGFKNTIRGIFEKGVTVWSNPDDIGRIDPVDNEPIMGAYY